MSGRMRKECGQEANPKTAESLQIGRVESNTSQGEVVTPVHDDINVKVKNVENDSQNNLDTEVPETSQVQARSKLKTKCRVVMAIKIQDFFR